MPPCVRLLHAPVEFLLSPVRTVVLVILVIVVVVVVVVVIIIIRGGQLAAAERAGGAASEPLEDAVLVEGVEAGHGAELCDVVYISCCWLLLVMICRISQRLKADGTVVVVVVVRGAGGGGGEQHHLLEPRGEAQ